MTKPKTALAWSDYIPKSGTLTWTNGQTASKTIKINIPEDGLAEGNEAFQILLKNPVGATLTAPTKTTITILANNKADKTSENAKATRMTKLTDALDGEGLTWLTSDLSPWTKQPFVTVDGQAAAISGQSTPDQASWLQTDVEGPGQFTFDWLVKGAGTDVCLVIVDGEIRLTLRAGYDWAHETLTLGEGDHTVRWVFVGDGSLLQGAAYLDRVDWAPVAE